MVTGRPSEWVHLVGARLLPTLIALMLVMALSVTSTSSTAETAPWQSPLQEAGWEDAREVAEGFNPKHFSGSMYWVTQEVTGAVAFWTEGYTGEGIDIALIDSGVVAVDGLAHRGKIINGPDLSFESQADNLRHLDTYGHGTHLAGIIAGRDNELDDLDELYELDPEEDFAGMAPGSRLVSLKVADAQGATDVSQVIAAIDWVVQHRNDNGMNIRILNLSYGTDGVQNYQIDPLADAVERAWRAGIVVVVAAGNDGNGSALRNPAYDPYVIAVGSSETNWTYSAHDDTVSGFSNCGTPDRHVDIVAPGESIVSLRNPGSHADQTVPEAVVAGRFFLGSGTSQAAGVVSGAAALLLDQRPDMTPDQVKALLMATAQPINNAKSMCQGAGLIDLYAAIETKHVTSAQSHAHATGVGSLEQARGSIHVFDHGVALEGEQDIMGMPWTGYCADELEVRARETSVLAVSTTDVAENDQCLVTLWDGGSFNGAVWTGNSWSGNSWSGNSWSGNSWSGNSWGDRTWSGNSWGGNSWGGNSWSGGSWSGGSWSGNSWSTLGWE